MADKVVKCVLLDVDNVIITEIEEVMPENIEIDESEENEITDVLFSNQLDLESVTEEVEFIKLDLDEEENLDEKCWKGYERVPGTAKGSKGSCRKKSPMKKQKGGGTTKTCLPAAKIRGLSKEKIKLKLSKKNIPDSVIDSLIGILNSCEYARYTPSSSKEMKVDYDKAVDVISNIEKS